MAPDSNSNTCTSCLVCSRGFIAMMNSKEQAWALRRCAGSSRDMEEESGQKDRSAKEPPFTSLWIPNRNQFTKQTGQRKYEIRRLARSCISDCIVVVRL